ncbi:MAG TPA: rhodanese-like domain-containing protein [Bryobacteraceae bacterium]|nr:rhodanese-like domain-containing protein [Bryobacteraceae bacterium]
MPENLELTPRDVSARLNAGAPTVLIDVREPQEFNICRIEGSELMPMNTVPAELQRLESLADAGDIITICHHGVRSLQVTYWLRQQGLENCFSMSGGIDRWSLEIDPSVPRY